MKKAIPIKPFWYADVFVHPKVVTIITTVDKDGIVNAAPYAYFMHYDIMDKSPRILVGMRKFTHTYKNITATGEFVINFPSADYLEDIMETCRFYPEGVNELEHTRFTPVPSQTVKPPSIKESGQILECRLHKQYELDKTQAHVIGDISAIVVDEELIAMDREQRFKKLNLAMSIGDEKRKYFYFGKIGDIRMQELKSTTREKLSGAQIKTGMPWDEKALAGLMRIPPDIRDMVVEMSEDIIRQEGADRVTLERYLKLIEEYAPPDVQDMFKE
jgi:flavin reductase (DIM6/NTAB) family NADH-FMN oxidoreductase RutF